MSLGCLWFFVLNLWYTLVHSHVCSLFHSIMHECLIEYTEVKIISFRVGRNCIKMHILLFLPNASLSCQEFGDFWRKKYLCTLYGMMNFLGCYLLTFVGSWLINAKEWKLKWSVKILNISELIKDAVNWYTVREISRNLICWEATQFAFCQLHGRSSAWKFQDTNLTGLQNAEPPVFKSTTLFPLISNIVKMCQGQVSFLKKCLS